MKPTVPDTRPRRAVLWPWLLLSLFTLLAFYPMFRNSFVWSDYQLIVRNPAIKGLWPPARFFQTQETPIYSLKGHRPVMAFSLALDYALWKLRPFGYHLTNILLHLFCVFGVAFLAQRLSRSRGAGVLAGALFALLPGHAEAVIALEGRTDLLALLFVLLGLWSYRVYLNAGGWERTLGYLGSLAAFLLACFSKESGLALFPILVVYEGFILRQSGGPWRKRALRLLPFLLIALVYLGYRSRVFGGQLEDIQMKGLSPWLNFLMTFEVYAGYLRLLIFPLTLSPGHTDLIPGGLWNVRVLWGAALLLLTLAGMVWMLWRHPRAGFLAFWFVIGLTPTANFVFRPWVVERWLYLPSTGACALAGWGAWILYARANSWKRTAWAGIVLVVLLLLGIRTWLWTPAWKSDESLARAVLADSPGSAQGYFDLGLALARQGRTEEEISAFRKAVELDPGNAEAYANLGFALSEQGHYEEAITAYKKAVVLQPDFVAAYYHLGIALRKQGSLEEAITAFRKTIELTPEFATGYYRLAECSALIGKKDDALKYLADAVDHHFDVWPLMDQDPALASLRFEPGFKVLSATVKKRWQERQPGT